MWLSTQAETALISAATAAVVTMLVEYLAKPSLEARKERILGAHRARRETAAKLINLLNFLQHLYGLGSANPFLRSPGKAALQSMIESCDELTNALPQYLYSLPKRQRHVVHEAIRAIGAYTAPLNMVVVAYEGTDMLDQERQRNAGRLHVAPFVESVVYNMLYETTRAHAALTLTRRHPLNYHRQLRRLAKGAPPLPRFPAEDNAGAGQEQD